MLGQAAWLFLEGCCLLLAKLWEVTYLKEKPEFWKNPKRSLVRSGVLRQHVATHKRASCLLLWR